MLAAATALAIGLAVALLTLLPEDKPTVQPVAVQGTSEETARLDDAPDETKLVEGTVVRKRIRSTKNHPDFKPSPNTEEAEQQADLAKVYRYQAEIDLDVSRWVSGDGPKKIVIVRGVNFSELDAEGLHVATSNDWVNREKYDSIAVGEVYRFEVQRDVWFKDHYYALYSDEFSKIG